MITLNRRRTMGKKNLPYDAEIEYLESDGYAYIDTNYIPVSNTGVDIKFMPIEEDGYDLGKGYTIIGGREAYKVKNFVLYAPINWNNAYYFCLGDSTSARFTSESLLDIIHTAKFYQNSNKVYFDNVEGSVNGWGNFAYTVTLYIFRGHSLNAVGDTTVYKGKIRIYYTTIYEGENKVLDLIPVRKGNVGYMYDRISGKLFGNSGTGSFVLGNDI